MNRMNVLVNRKKVYESEEEQLKDKLYYVTLKDR